MGSTVLSNIIGGIAVLLLGYLGRGLLGMRADFRRFMGEHSWLIATSLWNRDKVIKIMDNLNMPIEDQPPSDLPSRKGHK